MANRGYVIYEDDVRVAIVTVKSANRKTGDMAQLWILRRDMTPLDAIANNGDEAICGDCPLRGVSDKTGKRQNRACYVSVIHAPSSVYKTYRAGGYPHATPSQAALALTGRAIRLGAYGDPSFLPFEVVRDLIEHASAWTGYTHQWRICDQRFAGVLMASADTVEGRREARAQGWRSFYVVPANTDINDIPNAVECAATRERRPLQCIDCAMCSGTRNGTRTNAVDIVINAHGTGAKYVTA